MPKTKVQKQEIVSELADKFRRMKSAVFTSIVGYTMPDADKLRAKGRKEGVDFVVAKKTLLARALKEAGIETTTDQFEGSILTSIGYQDEVAPAKLIAGLTKEKETIKMLGGVLEGKLVDAAAVKTLAKLPGKTELLAKMVGSLNAPISGFVNVLAGNLRALVYALNAIKESKT
jgi:large subunit ribosomal protein L10